MAPFTITPNGVTLNGDIRNRLDDPEAAYIVAFQYLRTLDRTAWKKGVGIAFPGQVEVLELQRVERASNR